MHTHQHGRQLTRIPKMKHSGITDRMEELAYMLFGHDAYIDSDNAVGFVKPDLVDFIGTLLAYSWNQADNATKNQFRRFEEGKEEAKTEYESKLGISMLLV